MPRALQDLLVGQFPCVVYLTVTLRRHHRSVVEAFWAVVRVACGFQIKIFVSLGRVNPHQSSAGSSWGVRSHSWGRRRAAYQGQGLQASIDVHSDSSSGSSLVIVLSLGNAFIKGASQIDAFLVYLAVAGEQGCLAGSYLVLVQGWLASSSSHLVSFHSASFRSLPER